MRGRYKLLLYNNYCDNIVERIKNNKPFDDEMNIYTNERLYKVIENLIQRDKLIECKIVQDEIDKRDYNLNNFKNKFKYNGSM